MGLSVFEELAVEDKSTLLHVPVSVCQVLVPEPVFVVPIVYRLHECSFCWLTFNLIQLCILLSMEVSLGRLDLRFYLELTNVLLLVEDLIPFSSAFSLTFISCQKICYGGELILFFFIVGTLLTFDQLLHHVVFLLELVLSKFTDFVGVQDIELNFLHHLLAKLDVKSDLLCLCGLSQTAHKSFSDRAHE